MRPARIPAAALPQFWSDTIHAFVVVFVCVCVAVLATLHDLPTDVAGAVFTGALGYAAGRAGPVSRNSPTRLTDGQEAKE